MNQSKTFYLLRVAMLFSIATLFLFNFASAVSPQYNNEDTTTSSGTFTLGDTTINNYYTNVTETKDMTNVCFENESNLFTEAQTIYIDSARYPFVPSEPALRINASTDNEAILEVSGMAYSLYGLGYPANDKGYSRFLTGIDSLKNAYFELHAYPDGAGGGFATYIDFATEPASDYDSRIVRFGSTNQNLLSIYDSSQIVINNPAMLAYFNSSGIHTTQNVVAQLYRGNGSLLTGVCKTSGADCPASSGGDNSSWNESRANTLYSTIQWNYNQSTYPINYLNSTYGKFWYNMSPTSAMLDSIFGCTDGKILKRGGSVWECHDDDTGNYDYNQTTPAINYLNSTYGKFWYNHTSQANTTIYNTYNSQWISTYNATYAASSANNSWNESRANTLYSPISLNQTLGAINYLNSTYGKFWYNETCRGYTLYNTTFCRVTVGGTTQSCYLTAPKGYINIEVGGWVNGTTAHVFQTLYVNNAIATLNAHSRAAAANPTNIYLQNVSYPTTSTLYNATVITSGGVLNWVTIKMEAYKEC